MVDGGLDNPGTLLCVAAFPANTGFAWDFIEGLFAGLADRLAERGVATRVAYPAVASSPRPLAGSAARAVLLPLRLGSPVSWWRVLRFVRRERVRVAYLADRPVAHPFYAALRLAGVGWIVVHDHTSGARTPPAGMKRLMKAAFVRLPGVLADRVVAVSDFVATRKREVDLVPAARVRRIWNSVPLPAMDPALSARRREALGLEMGRPVVACACRAAPEKGVQHLLRAFDRLCATEMGATLRPQLLYMGDGPHLPALRELRDALPARDSITLAGYVPDAAELLAGCTLCVVPSVWEEAFGLAALEPMARAVPVVASRVGGIPEVLLDGETGLLVPPADERGLATAMARLLADPELRLRLGEAGRRRAAEHFSREAALDALGALIEAAFPAPDQRASARNGALAVRG